MRRRRLAQVGACAGGCAETVARGSRASTHPYAPGNGREPPHLPGRQLIIFMTLHSNSRKRTPCVLPLYTIHMHMYTTNGHEMVTFGQKVARKWAKLARFCLGTSAVARPSLECQVIVIPWFLLCDHDL